MIHLCAKEKPRNMKRVMTYAPTHVGDMARNDATDGIAILSWNETEQRWCDDNGESPVHGTPRYWWDIDVPDLVANEAGADRRKRRQVRALRESQGDPNEKHVQFVDRQMWEGLGFKRTECYHLPSGLTFPMDLIYGSTQIQRRG